MRQGPSGAGEKNSPARAGPFLGGAAAGRGFPGALEDAPANAGVAREDFSAPIPAVQREDAAAQLVIAGAGPVWISLWWSSWELQGDPPLMLASTG